MSQNKSSSNINQKYNGYNRNQQNDEYDPEEYRKSNQYRQSKQGGQSRQEGNGGYNGYQRQGQGYGQGYGQGHLQNQQYGQNQRQPQRQLQSQSPSHSPSHSPSREQSKYYQNNGSNGSNGSYERKRTTETLDKGKDSSELKLIVKEVVKRNYRMSISEITSDKIDMIVLNVYNIMYKDKQNVTRTENDDRFLVNEMKIKTMILATVLGEIIKNVPHMKSGLSEYVESIRDKISSLIVKTKFNTDKTQKNVMGYDIINSFCWPGISRDINEKEYLETLKMLMIYCNYDVSATNNKNETALISFNNAVLKKKMQHFDSVVELLKTGHKENEPIITDNKIKDMINKVTSSYIAEYSNLFKLALITRPDLLIDTIFETYVKTFIFSKKNGLYDTIVSVINLYKTLINDKLRQTTDPNDYDGILTTEYFSKNNITDVNIQRNALFSKLMMGLAHVSLDFIKKVENDIIVLEIDDTRNRYISAAFIGEASYVLQSTHYTEFVFSQLSCTSELSQQNILVATAHLMNRYYENLDFHINKFITPLIMDSLDERYKKNLLKSQFFMLFEQLFINLMNNVNGVNSVNGKGKTVILKDNLFINIKTAIEKQSKLSLESLKNIKTNSNVKQVKNIPKPKITKDVKNVKNMFDMLDIDTNVANVANDTNVANIKNVINIVNDITNFIDRETYGSMMPTFTQSKMSFDKNSDGSWKDSNVDDWAYSIEKYNNINMDKFINTMFIVVLDDIGEKSESMDRFPDLFDAVIGHEKVKIALKNMHNDFTDNYMLVKVGLSSTEISTFMKLTNRYR